MTGWTPLFSRIVGSSIWDAPDHVRIAWITLLAITDKKGVAHITVGGLARFARITREQAEDAVLVLSSPDSESLTINEDDGRRIERMDDGFRVLNWEKYRTLAKSEAVREANAQYQADFRRRQAEEAAQAVADVPAQTKSYESARPILHYLNELSGRRFRETDTNLSFIAARLSEEGVVVDDVKRMIARQCALWKTDPKMSEYLRPETLFNKTKFDSYYAAVDVPTRTPSAPVPAHKQPSGPPPELTQQEVDAAWAPLRASRDEFLKNKPIDDPFDPRHVNHGP